MTGVFTLMLCLCTFLPVLAAGQAILLSLGEAMELQVDSNSTEEVRVEVESLGPKVIFVIVEVHTHVYNVSASYNATLNGGYFATGGDVGLLLGQGPGQVPLTSTVYLINDNEVPVDILLILQAYDEFAPIPGGCNMEVSIKTAPFLPTILQPNVLTVEYPLGAWPLNVIPATCDRAPLQYDIYDYYLPERDFSNRTAFDSIRLMSGVEAIEKNGRKVEFNGVPPSKLKFANYAGTGRIVAIIVRSLTSSASYVPTLSYGCNTLVSSVDDELYSCEVLATFGPKLLSGFLVFVGLFLTMFGHRFYKSQLFFLGFCATAIIFYIIFLNFVEVTPSAAGMISTSVGAVGGALWLTLWARWGVPLMPLFLSATILGILFASTVAYTPLADYSVLKEDATFWLAFFCLVLVMPLALLSFGRLTSILWCSIVGSYIFLVPIDHYVGSNLKFIILNVLRRATDGYFRNSIIDPPYQYKDIILTVVWALLSVSGTGFQWWRERGRSPFPPVPTWPSRGRPTTTTTESNPTEATPLLS